MSMRFITGLAFQGERASWVTIDTDDRKPGPVEVHEIMLGEGSVSFSMAGESGASNEIESGLKAASEGIRGNVAVSIPSDQVLIRVMTLPTSDEEEIAGMVKLQIDKVSPFPVENMVIAHEVLSCSADEVLVAALAAKREVIERAGNMLLSSKIVPVRIDVNALVWWRLLKDSPLVDAGREEVYIIYAWNSCEVIVARNALPIAFRSFLRGKDQAQSDYISDICDEIGYAVMSLEIGHGQLSGLGVLLLSSDESACSDFQSKISQFCRGGFRYAQLSELGDLAAGVASRTAEGVSLDLTPPDIVEKRRKKFMRKRFLKGGAVFLGCWLLVLSVMYGGLFVQNLRLSRLRKSIDAIKNEASEVRDLRRKVNTISLYVDRSRSALECLREMALLKPEGIDLAVFNYRKGEAVRISGEAGDVNIVYEFKKSLDSSSLFKDVQLDGPRRIKNRELFDIDCRFEGSEE